MAEVLARIVERKRREVADRLSGGAPLAPPTSRSLRDALARPGARFVMEIKRRSPSGHRSDVPLERAVTAYAPVADAISVLTDGPDFGGSLDDLRAVRALYAGPILAKDFVVDPAQVAEARAAGADAVLAMLSVLPDADAAAVLAAAARLGMDVLVEVHDETEMARALALGATLVGINNRDLKTLTTDLAVTERLAPLVPSHVTLVAESGLATNADVRRLSPLVDAFLVGSSLMASPSIEQAARSLVFGPTKLCGLTRAEDVALAATAGATHAGFVMVAQTPRGIEPALAAALADQARSSGLVPVGVERDTDPRTAVRRAELLGLGALQLHGGESAADFRAMLDPAIELWAACPVGDRPPPCRPGADRTVFDTARDGGSGGTGRSFEWSLVEGLADLPAAFLAGGIGPGNARAARRVGAYGLDVGSGVESRPGHKDPALVAALFDALRPEARA